MSSDLHEISSNAQTPFDRYAVKLQYVSTAKYGGDWHSTPHTHTCFELFYVVGGVGQFMVNGELLPVESDDLVIINPNVEHTEVSLNSRPLEYIVLGVAGLELSLKGENNQYVIANFKGVSNEIYFCLRAILHELEEMASGYEMVCQNLLEVMLVRIMRRVNVSMALVQSMRKGNRECAMVRRYIDNHYKENITLNLLAEYAHINKYYMVHSFKKEYDISPINYLISRRIQESRYLLSKTNHSLSQISNMLGFSSQSYFSQSFRSVENMSPFEYRMQNRKKAD